MEIFFFFFLMTFWFKIITLERHLNPFLNVKKRKKSAHACTSYFAENKNIWQRAPSYNGIEHRGLKGQK